MLKLIEQSHGLIRIHFRGVLKLKIKNVLSLFDGMSCGQIALNRAGIEYDNYYASEIDKHAISVTQHNYPKTIQIGDVTKIKSNDLSDIDLLIGGSPCQGFSFAGKQLNFNDPRSKLFFEYVRLLKEIKPKWFLLENVVMKKQSENIITSCLEVDPIKINSSLVSAQTRNRLYWTNIPNITQPDDRHFTFIDVKDTDENNYKFLSDKQHLKIENKEYVWKSYYKFIKDCDKVPCLMAQIGSDAPRTIHNNKIRYLTPLEWERLQTVPDNYTSCVNTNHRYKMLGNGWTVDVISHILSKISEDITPKINTNLNNFLKWDSS